MVYAANTIKVSVSGSMPNGARFSWGFQTQGTAGSLAVRCGAAIGIVQGWLASSDSATIRALMPNGNKIDTISAYGYDGSAHAAASDTAGANVPGTGTTITLPNQAALVVSIRTAGTGRSARGRAFLPCSSLALSVGQADASTIQTVADEFKTLLDLFPAGTGDGMPQTAVVASPTHNINRPVTYVVVDSRLDVIRHRAQRETILHMATSSL